MNRPKRMNARKLARVERAQARQAKYDRLPVAERLGRAVIRGGEREIARLTEQFEGGAAIGGVRLA